MTVPIIRGSTTSGGNSTAVLAHVPAGVVTGDRWLAALACDGKSASASTAWTKHLEIVSTSTAVNVSVALFSRLAALSSTEAGETATFGISVADTYRSISVVLSSDADLGAIVLGAGLWADGGAVAHPDVQSTRPDSLVLALASKDNDGTPNHLGTPSSFVNLHYAQQGGSVSLRADYVDQPGQGGPGTVTWVSTSAGEWAAILALIPSVNPVGGGDFGSGVADGTGLGVSGSAGSGSFAAGVSSGFGLGTSGSAGIGSFPAGAADFLGVSQVMESATSVLRFVYRAGRRLRAQKRQS